MPVASKLMVHVRFLCVYIYVYLFKLQFTIFCLRFIAGGSLGVQKHCRPAGSIHGNQGLM